MRWVILLAVFLPSCAGLADQTGVSVAEQAEHGSRMLGHVLTGNYVGAVGQGIDLALLLIGGYAAKKAATKGYGMAKGKPKAEAKT